MLYPSINEIRKKADSRYTLVIMAAKRARDIVNKKPVITRNGTIDKPVSIAAQEIAEDLVTYKSVETLAAEKEKAMEVMEPLNEGDHDVKVEEVTEGEETAMTAEDVEENAASEEDEEAL